jgi:Fusaric acid resistance protein-like
VGRHSSSEFYGGTIIRRMGLAMALWRGITVVDRTKLRRWSALRRGAIVLLAFGVGSAVGDWDIGALASVSALFVGLQERNAAASYTSRVMVVQSLFYGVLMLVAGALAFVPLVPMLLLTLVAAASGLTSYHDKSMSRMFGDAMPVAAFLGVSLAAPVDAPQMAVAVLLGGLGQALGALASIRVESDLMERRGVAAALVGVADHLDDALPRRRKTTGQTAEERLNAATDFLSGSDLRGPRRRELRSLITVAELLRQEAAAVRIRRALTMPIGDEAQIAAALTLGSQTLRATATSLTSTAGPGHAGSWRSSALATVAAHRAAADAVRADRGADPTARAISRQTVRLARHLAGLVEAEPVRDRRKGRQVGQGLVGYLLRPTRRDLMVGVRLAVATVVSLAVAQALDLSHGAWVASTTVSLLRPDWRPLTVDTIARVIGTASAAALAVPLIMLTGNGAGFDVALLLVMAVLTFVIAAANEGLYVMATSLVTVFTRGVVGENPVAAAIIRVEDVLVGAAIAVVFLLFIPVWHGRRLSRDLAEYASATAAWLDGVGVLVGGENPPQEKKLRAAMRRARVQVQHGIELRVAEPMGPGLSAWRAEVLFDRVHNAARAAAAAERALKHGGGARPEGSALAGDAATALRHLAGRLRRQQVGRLQPLQIAVDSDDDVDVLLQRCDRSAREAVAALTSHQQTQSQH